MAVNRRYRQQIFILSMSFDTGGRGLFLAKELALKDEAAVLGDVNALTTCGGSTRIGQSGDGS